MTTLDYNDISTALWTGINVYGLKVPYGEHRILTPETSMTEEGWGKYQWNPPPLYADRYIAPDPDASPKPGWPDLVKWWRVSKIDAKYGDSVHYLRVAADPTRRQITDQAKLDVGGRSVHVGDGLDHMTGLLQMAEQATAAGSTLPHIVLRDGDQLKRSVHRQSEIRTILEATARRENVVESAHNAVLARYHALERIKDDETESLDDRENAASKMLALAMNYEAELKKELAAYDPDALPSDLDVLKEVYIERLEAAATGRQQHIKGALTQQAIDNWASCIDQDKALAAVARECALGVIAIGRADDDLWSRAGGNWTKLADDDPMPATIRHEGTDEPAAGSGADGEFYRQLTGAQEAAVAFTTAKGKIDAVSAAHVPEWQVNGTPVTSVRPISVAGKSLTVRAASPAGTEAGDVVIRSWAVKYAPGTKKPPKLSTRFVRPVGAPGTHQFHVMVAADAKFPLEFTLDAWNLCGPSLDVQPPGLM